MPAIHAETPANPAPPVSPHAALPGAPARGRRGEIVFVSAGLGLDGGGRAAAGRLLAGAVADFARRAGLGLTVLTLGREGAPGLWAPTRCFGDRHTALAARTWSGQLASRRAAYVFDFLGCARAQAWLPKALRAPYLVVLYGLEVWRPLGGDRARALRNAAVRLAISRATVERAQEVSPALHSILEPGGDPLREPGSQGTGIVPLALEERPPAGKADRALLAQAGEGYVLIVGRMASGERYKGHDELLAALPAVAARVPGARLVIAGDGDDRPRLEARAADLGMGSRVLFTGFVSEATLAELYRRAAVFAMPSSGEGFGLVYLEAMRAGVPCVAARQGAAAEVVADGETGLLVDPARGEELTGALVRLLAEPGFARRLGEAGRRRWLQDFSVARYRERLRPYLERLVAA